MREKNKEKKEEIEWDRRKIFAFLILALILIFAAYQLRPLTLNQSISKNYNPVPASQTAPDIKAGVSQQINLLKEEAANIDVLEVASSSPQVQKAIRDLQ